jgi:hypothetical protein
MIEDDSPSTSSSGVRAASSTKNTRPLGSRQSATRDQKGSNRPSGTCDSQNPKKDHVVKAIGLPSKMSVWTNAPVRCRVAQRRWQACHARRPRRRCQWRSRAVGRSTSLARSKFEHTASRPKRITCGRQLIPTRQGQCVVLVLRGEGAVVSGLLIEEVLEFVGSIRRSHGRDQSGHGGVRQLLTILAAAIGPGRAPDRRPHQFADSEYAASPASTTHRPLGRTACR